MTREDETDDIQSLVQLMEASCFSLFEPDQGELVSLLAAPADKDLLEARSCPIYTIPRQDVKEETGNVQKVVTQRRPCERGGPERRQETVWPDDPCC